MLSNEEQTTINTYRRLAKKWASSHDQSDFWKEELEKFYTLLPKGSVLEIGCGGGRDAEHLIKHGYDYTGTDIVYEFVDLCNKRFPNSSFHTASIEEVAEKFPEYFDGFWASAVLLHIPKSKLPESIRQIANTLKPGGVGFVSVKKGDGEKLEAREEGDERFFSYFQLEEITEFLRAENIEVLANHEKQTGNTTWLCLYVRKRNTKND